MHVARLNQPETTRMSTAVKVLSLCRDAFNSVWLGSQVVCYEPKRYPDLLPQACNTGILGYGVETNHIHSL